MMSCAAGALILSGGGAYAAAAAAGRSATADAAFGEVVVTAERKEENLQSTPVAVSAFSQETLKAKGLQGGQDLLLQIPNANYSRTNFGGFDFKIRGVGAGGVSINENELPLGFNHFADTEFYDVQRVEVVRGPQGTLYGRNATGGAVDVITNKPANQFGGYGAFEYGAYNTIKVQGAVNLPLGDVFALRLAGVRITSEGFGVNSYLNQRVDGRDLGSLRATLRFKPSDKFDAYLMYEHYEEDDTRNRVGKQLCISDPGPASVGGVSVPAAGGPIAGNYAAFLNQGCVPGPLNSAAAYGAYNTLGALDGELANFIGLSNGTNLNATHPLQNTNLHDIESTIQPLWRGRQDILDLHMAYHITDSLTLTSITGFSRYVGVTAEDYNRLVTAAPFTPSGIAAVLFPNGVVHDPQVGASNLLRNYDYGVAKSKEYTEEIRLASSFAGRFNVSSGLFYSELTSQPQATNYYVQSNALTAYALANNFAYDAIYDGALAHGAPASLAAALAAKAAPSGGLINIDQGYPPTGSGHNYYDAAAGGGYIKSYAVFGEFYYDITPTLKLTLGGRYTVDQLHNIKYPIGLASATPNNGPVFADPGFPALGIPGTPTAPVGGFPSTVCTTSLAACLVPQNVTYREFTGRANLDWTPILSFTNKTLIYLSYSRGYKGGGFNTPCQASLGGSGAGTAACGYPLAYAPEFINAYEIGTKNTLLGGSLTLNADAFYYDYTGYQISTIVAESSVNENINAKIYGVEFESAWRPIHNLALNANIGYLHTSINNGQSSIDSLNLTQGNPNYTLVKQTSGANCLAPTKDVAEFMALNGPAPALSALCAGIPGTPFRGSGTNQFGIPDDLSGKKMPNTPDWTLALGAQYTLGLTDSWKATLRGDYYWQASSFARIDNAVNDYLTPYHVVNATLTLDDRAQGLQLQFFVKNAFNAQPITGIYVTDASSALFINVFTLDPRTYGARVTKTF